MVRPTLEYASALCMGSPQARGHPAARKSSTPSSQVRDQQIHRQITRHCYIHARKSEADKSRTSKKTDPPGDAQKKKINNGLVDISVASFFRHSDPRETQRLHQEQAQHPVLFHSFFFRSLRMEPPPYIHFFSPFTWVLPESTRPQHQDHVYSFNVVSTCLLLS